jgi:hypothetical protein
MAFHLDYQAEKRSIFICAFSTLKLELNTAKFKFISGLGYAAYVAAFDFDESRDGGGSESEQCSLDLDQQAGDYSPGLDHRLLNPKVKIITASQTSVLPNAGGHNTDSLPAPAHAPTSPLAPPLKDPLRPDNAVYDPSQKVLDMVAGRRRSGGSSVCRRSWSGGTNLATSMPSPTPSSSGVFGLGAMNIRDGQPLSRGGSVGGMGYTGLNATFPPPQSPQVTGIPNEQLPTSLNMSPAAVPLILKASNNEEPRSPLVRSNLSIGTQKKLSHELEGEEQYSAPSWEPRHPFSFRISNIPANFTPYAHLDLQNMSHLKKLSGGSNSDIYTANLSDGTPSVIKMIKASAMYNSLALHEFEVEHGVLARISHPNIVQLLGAGSDPQKFFVLEHLGKGTLQTLLDKNSSEGQIFASRLFRKPSFTYKSLLSNALDIANALNYLHNCVHADACIIHRDLKPDNIGFAMDGSLKLLDFGLCTVVNKGDDKDEVYKMTGNTGSLRYMAPEVVLRKPYNSSVDVYSFGILLWQMARDQVPFQGYGKEQFVKEVVLGGLRPKLDKSWPAGLTDLIVKSWHMDSRERPTFPEIQERLRSLIKEDLTKNSIPTPTPTPTSMAGS